MKSLWVKINNSKGFTLVETLITLTIIFIVIVLTPRPNSQLAQQLEHELLLNKIEHQIALFQQNCLFLESYGVVRFYSYPINRVIFIQNYENDQQISTISIPASLKILSNREIRFEKDGKSASVFTLTLQSNQFRYIYRVQLGGGRLFRDEQRISNF